MSPILTFNNEVDDVSPFPFKIDIYKNNKNT